ncbi:MAG TPA: hypothetical protein PLC19_10255 [Marmoricola sp.]|nr:hypothetical protein [Marmoricola sp.]
MARWGAAQVVLGAGVDGVEVPLAASTATSAATSSAVAFGVITRKTAGAASPSGC